MGAAAGLAFLATERRSFLVACRVAATVALALQAWSIAQAAQAVQGCALRDPWGVMAVFTVGGLAGAWWASHRARTPRILIGAVVLLAVTMTAACWLLPDRARFTRLDGGWMPVLHIFFILLAISSLVVGCVSGGMLLLRSLSLKFTSRSFHSGIPWPSLIALDGLFFHSIGVGIVLMLAGIGLGFAGLGRGEPPRSPWYHDPKVMLSLAGLAIYGAVWHLRRRRGFSSWTLIGLSTLAFVFVLSAFFVPGVWSWGFHPF